jgi:MFS family permease
VAKDHSGGYLDLLRRNVDFRRLYLASLISLGGDWFLTVALLDLVLEVSGSATLASLIVVLQTLPVFFATPFAGHLIDRMDRRKLMIGVDLARTGAALLPMMAHSPETLVFAYLGVVSISIGGACFDPAAQASLPNMVDAADLSRANVLIGSTWGTMLAVGAALGGLVTMRFGRNTSFIVDSLSFLVSALMLMRIRVPFSEAREEHAHSAGLMESLRETFRYSRGHPRVLALLVSKGGYGLGAGVVAMLSVFGREVFHRGAFGIGLLYAARGVGALLGPFMVRGAARSDDQMYRWMGPAVCLFGAGYIGLAMTHVLWLGAAAVFLAHLGGGAQWLTSSYGLQREVPDHLRGRVFSADFGMVTLTMSASSICAGVLADHRGAPTGTAVVASICILWGVGWGLATWRLWRVVG